MARILIIEDEKDMAQGLKDNFEFDGHEVILAEDGERDWSRHKPVSRTSLFWIS